MAIRSLFLAIQPFSLPRRPLRRIEARVKAGLVTICCHLPMEKLGKFFNIYLLLTSVLLTAGFVFLFLKVNTIASVLNLAVAEQSVDLINNNQPVVTREEDFCGTDCQGKIDQAVARAVAAISATVSSTQTKTPTPAKSAPAPTKSKQTVYIPLAGPITTTSTGWVDAAGTDVYIDSVGEYGKGAYVSWDAFLAVANSNGKAYARLYDATHGIAVNGSEIAVENSAVSTQVSSGALNFWAGRNLYRVQIKSLNSFVITFGSGRIKVTY